MLEKVKNVLILAPHPDDEVLGCGGIISKLISHDIKVAVLIVTRGKRELYSEERIMNVRKEALNAHRLLGVTETGFLDFPAPDLDTIPLSEISQAISNVIVNSDINALFIPHRGDIHNDHRIVFNAGLVASRPVGNCKVRRIYSYETLSETEWAAPFSDDAFIPTSFVNITDVFHLKLEAMKCFKSQLRDFPNPRSLKSIEALANMRGSTVGFTHAEAFMTIRVIED
jgi:LmbE family N-acetylglucosaminyl deacetylase